MTSAQGWCRRLVHPIGLGVAALLVATSTTTASAVPLPVPEAIGYDYSAGEPAIFDGPRGTAIEYIDNVCSGSYAVAGDSGFFLLSRCSGSTSGGVRGDLGAYADVAASRVLDPTVLLRMRPGNDAHQHVIDPLTARSPGDGLIRRWMPTAEQKRGMLVGKMGVGSGWTEGRILGLAPVQMGAHATYAVCTDAPTKAGDVGGPVWRNDEKGLQALGTVVGQTSTGGACYRPIQETLYEYGAYLPSSGAPQGRPGFGRFSPDLAVIAGESVRTASYSVEKGHEWRR